MYTLFATADLEQQITSLGLRTVLIASIILGVCTLLALAIQKKKKIFKKLSKPLFIIMAGTMAISTITLFGSTIYLNNASESKGPVHWHADIEFWSCGAELELRDPTGFLSNKIGTTTYHEHNDKRIHLEGVVVRKSEDASLKKFMTVTGGYLEDDRIGIPLNGDSNEWFASEKNDKLDGDKQYEENFRPATGAGEWVRQDTDGAVLDLQNGRSCSEGDEAPAELQVFVLRFNQKTDTYYQEKLTKPTSYVIRDEPLVPPGDCVIVEYDVPKARTDKLCQQYGVKDSKRCVEFGVKSYDPKLCKIKDITSGGTE